MATVRPQYYVGTRSKRRKQWFVTRTKTPSSDLKRLQRRGKRPLSTCSLVTRGDWWLQIRRVWNLQACTDRLYVAGDDGAEAFTNCRTRHRQRQLQVVIPHHWPRIRCIRECLRFACIHVSHSARQIIRSAACDWVQNAKVSGLACRPLGSSLEAMR